MYVSGIPRIVLVAKFFIAKDSELVFDYGDRALYLILLLIFRL